MDENIQNTEQIIEQINNEIRELKVRAYDLLAQRQGIDVELNSINGRLAELHKK